MSSFTLTSAELAVLINHMTGGRLLEGSPALPEMQVDEQALAAAEEELLDRRLLVSLPFEQVSGVTSELASVLSAAITPGRACIVRVVHGDHTDPPLFVSFTPECITLNQVGEGGQHVFTRLAETGEAVSAILTLGAAAAEEVPARKGAAKKAPVKKGRAAIKPRPLADLLKEATRLVMLMVVADPAEPAAAAHGLSWLETDQGLWLVDAASDGEAPLGAPIALKVLRQQIAAAVER